MTSSKKAARYGSRAEKKAAERYGLTLDHCSWHDAKKPDGTPVEIKATMETRADGSEGRFRVFRDYHDKLRRADGIYVFVGYRPHGTGIMVLNMRTCHSSQLPLSTWYGAGGHRESEQRKISVSEVF
jgi:hypothetical protein